MRKKQLISLLLCLCLLFLSACAPQATTPPDDGVIQIGFCFDSFIIERWIHDRDIFIDTAGEKGAEVLVEDAGGSLDEQIAQIEGLIEKGVDAIVIVATDSEGLSSVVTKAKNKGIYVICYDRIIMNAPVDLYLTVNSYNVGLLMAQNMIENMSETGNIVCINGSKNDINVTRMQEGFASAFRGSGLRIISTDYCSGWEAAEAYDVMQYILNSGASFQGVMCGNDDLAAMVTKALAERGMLDGICIVGQDAELSACQRIVAGWQSMTVYKPMELLAEQAALSVIDLIEQGSLSTDTTTSNGYAEIPTVLLEPVAVTAENMDEVIIDSGFHKREEVYGH